MRAIAITGVVAVTLLAAACTGPAAQPPVASPTASASACPEGTVANEEFCFSDDPIAEQLAAVVRSAYEADDLGAVIAGVWHDGKPVMVGAIGESMTSVPATIDMHHRLGNLAWPMLTTLVLQQVDAGVFSLDDTLSTWFPELPGSDQVTVKMLLQNTSGYTHYTQVQSFLDALWEDPFRQWVLDDVVAYGVQDGPTFTPGTEWNFSDTNGLLMIKVLEAATGQPVLDLAQEGIWEPLGMHDTTPPLDSVQAEPVLHGYSNERGFWEDVSFWNPTWTSFVGGLASNQEDVRTFLDALGSGELLSDELHDQQLSPELAGLGPWTDQRYWAMGTVVVNGWTFMNPGLSGYYGAGGTLLGEGWTMVVYNTTTRTGDQSLPAATNIFKDLTAIVSPDHILDF